MERDDDVPQPLRSHFSNLVERLQQSPKTAPSLRDQREAPDLDALSAALSLALQCVHDVLDGTNVEDELPSILHGFVDVFHKQMRKNDRALSAQAEAVRTLVMEQDGSEIASVNLEEATREGERLETLSEALTVGRDAAAVCFENLLGSAWVPHSGSKGKSALVTSAILDADDFLRKHGRGTGAPAQQGQPVLITGDRNDRDAARIRSVCEALAYEYPDMLLLVAGQKQGSDPIVTQWAADNGRTVVRFPPKGQARDRFFRRNADMIAARPVCVVHFSRESVYVQDLVKRAFRANIRTVDGYVAAQQIAEAAA